MTTKTTHLASLLSTAPPCIAIWVADYDAVSTSLWRLRGDTAASNVFVGLLRGRRMRRREGAFEQFGALLQFPHYFGENWNAFLDCLRDLDWLRANGFVLAVLDAAEVLADGDPDEFNLFLQLLTEAGNAWARADEFRPATPFHVLLHTNPAQSSVLRAKLDATWPGVPLVEFPPA